MFGHTALFHRICEVYSYVRPTLQLGGIDLFRKLLPLFNDLEQFALSTGRRACSERCRQSSAF
jgi:hypothetical protein